MDDFQSYIPHMSWEAGEQVAMVPVPFTGVMKAQLVMDGALHHQYHQELVKLDWNIFTQHLEETIPKLESAKPADILLQKELMARLPTPTSAKSTSSTNKRKAPSQTNGRSTKKQKKPQCPICGKFYHGECWYTKTSTKSKDTGSRGRESNLKVRIPQIDEADD